jgi:hypothetical protein
VKSFTAWTIRISLGVMKPLPAAGFVAVGLAAGILLGRGSVSRDPSAGEEAQPAAASARSTKSDRSAAASLHPGIQTIRQARPGELAAIRSRSAACSPSACST